MNRIIFNGTGHSLLGKIIHIHGDVIKWKHFPCYWPFVRGIHRSPVNSTLKGQWCWALKFSLICAWIIDWVNNHEAGDLRRSRSHEDVTVMLLSVSEFFESSFKYIVTNDVVNSQERVFELWCELLKLVFNIQGRVSWNAAHKRFHGIFVGGNNITDSAVYFVLK